MLCPRFPKKVQYAERDHAIIVMKRMKNKRLSVYRCTGCRQWHVGNGKSPWKVQSRTSHFLKQ